MAFDHRLEYDPARPSLTADNQLARMRAEADGILASFFGGGGGGEAAAGAGDGEAAQATGRGGPGGLPKPAAPAAHPHWERGGRRMEGGDQPLETGSLRVLDDDLADGPAAGSFPALGGSDGGGAGAAEVEAFPTLSAWARNGAEPERARQIRYAREFEAQLRAKKRREAAAANDLFAAPDAWDAKIADDSGGGGVGADGGADDAEVPDSWDD